MLSQLGHLPRFVRLTLIITILIIIPTLYLLYPTPERLPSKGEYQSGGIDSDHWRKPIQPDYLREEVREYDDDDFDGLNKIKQWNVGGISEKTINGGVIMPKLGNETAKAELGRSAWKVLHLMTLRYPDEPTEDDRQALKSYFHLFSRLYPCGECATEFQQLLKQYPPQTSSRKSASLWLCHVHNLVNERLGKPEFDCLTLDETYDCGCGDDQSTTTTTQAESTTESEETGYTHVKVNTEEDERDLKDELVLGHGGGEVHVKSKQKPKVIEPELSSDTLKEGYSKEETYTSGNEVDSDLDKAQNHRKLDNSQPYNQLNEVNEEENLENQFENDQSKYEQEHDNYEDKKEKQGKSNDLNRHDGSRIKVDDEDNDQLEWDE
ncbi:uncharacterized protein L201_007997 [Kwoniella dendrophila CBS 6074]|uniref:Sulfhydryl oxidase n=1 Tax=Kwoniella dendrophila CBS 6074 TaxID=1295534 RepID=A0AAX4K7H5_9TREE